MGGTLIDGTGAAPVPDAAVVIHNGRIVAAGNEFEFITAVRDAIAHGHGLGPRLLLAGIVDGTGALSLGVDRVDTPEPAEKLQTRLRRDATPAVAHSLSPSCRWLRKQGSEITINRA